MRKKDVKLVTKPELSNKLAEETGITYAQADFFLDALSDVLVDYTLQGREVLLQKVGKFVFVDRNTRTISNLNGKPIVPHKQLVFKVNQKLARDVRVGTRRK